MKNSNSIVLLVEYQGSRLYLMGDAFISGTENVLISNFRTAFNLGGATNIFAKAAGDQSLLKMGHHGSDTSTGDDWYRLEETSPRRR